MIDHVTDALKASLSGLGDEFRPNRLAYQSLTAKNEVLLCGGVASLLDQAYADDRATQIRREWWNAASNAYFDIAVLSFGDPVALIEAKAAMSFDLASRSQRPYPSKAVLHDVEKLRRLNVARRYVVMFVTHPHRIPRREFDVALPYIDGIRRRGTIEEPELEAGFERFHQAVGDLPVVTSGEIEAGTAFEVDVSVFYWLMTVPD